MPPLKWIFSILQLFNHRLLNPLDNRQFHHSVVVSGSFNASVLDIAALVILEYFIVKAKYHITRIAGMLSVQDQGRAVSKKCLAIA